MRLTCRASSGSKSGVARSRWCRDVSGCDVVSRLRCHTWLPRNTWYTSCAWYLKNTQEGNGCSISGRLRRMRCANRESYEDESCQKCVYTRCDHRSDWESFEKVLRINKKEIIVLTFLRQKKRSRHKTHLRTAGQFISSL